MTKQSIWIDRYTTDIHTEICIKWKVIKGTVMQIEITLMNEPLHLSKVSGKYVYFCSTVPVKFAIFLEVTNFFYFLTVSIAFPVY